ncbi:MAG: sugar ABC transporter permease [Myxococcota bacterium]
MDEARLRPSRRWHPWLMLAPSLVLLGVFFLYPVAVAAHRSFFRWDLLTAPEWVGGAHYRVLLEDGSMLAIAGRTLLYSGLTVVGSTSLGLALALVLNREGLVYAWIRGAVFSAYVVSWVAVGLLWLWLLDPDAGLVSAAAELFVARSPAWLADPDWALFALIGVSVWKITGYAMVIFIAGLRDIPRSVLEAAALDGAGPGDRFWEIIWPLLRPTSAFVATTSLILSFQAFDIVRVMTQGGPVQATTVFVYAIYEQVFLNLRVGRASALTMVFFVILLGLTALQLWAWRLAGSRNRAMTRGSAR